MNRTFDVVGAGAAAVVLAPVIAATAVFVRCTMGAPVLFRQERAGLHGRPFTLLKFRTMRPGGRELNTKTDADRLTPAGRFLRSSSLDELPALWNVLRGEMSLIGPRPLPTAYLGRYTSTQRRRHEVRPGITGLAQVRGRNSLSWEEKFAYDVEYVDHRSMSLDLKILAATVRTVFTRAGVNSEGVATAREFQGSRR